MSTTWQPGLRVGRILSVISCGVRRCGASTGRRAAPLDFAGGADSTAGSFSRGWPVRFEPAVDFTPPADYTEGSGFIGGADSTAGSVSVAGATLIEVISVSSLARRSFSSRRIAARPPVFGLTLLLIFSLCIGFKLHLGVSRIDQLKRHVIHSCKFGHLECYRAEA